MSSIRQLLGTPILLRRLALASLLANIGIVVTGGAVRLTGSGLGCPTWPRCTDTSYVTTPQMGAHGVIEFGNRTLTGVVGALAVACVLAALCQRPVRRPLVTWSALVLAGIPAQAVIGGVTVLTNLNPWVVGCHFLASMAVIAAAYQLWVRAGERPASSASPGLGRPLTVLVRLVVATAALVLVVGTVVTGSGPHAGDAGAKRTGLDPQEVAQLHADLVFLLLGLSVALWFALTAVGAPRTAAAALIGVELAQGLIGFVQYFTHLPVIGVGLHMLGACVVWVAALAVLEGARARAAPAPTAREAPTAADALITLS